ncbi:hypothetical protein [Alteromonas antoniana]|uniref:hypothetical protein n=1 Tax=Alteromonas antoniana TaxID=2803813 RepID=UPI001C46236D|nr:hypothetical protein [Alteromonas antoniana]
MKFLKTMSRAEIVRLNRNAVGKFNQRYSEARMVLDAINISTTADSYIIFMGFCPGEDFNNGIDSGRKEQGICRFDYGENEHQVERFNTICADDLVILKET